MTSWKSRIRGLNALQTTFSFSFYQFSFFFNFTRRFHLVSSPFPFLGKREGGFSLSHTMFARSILFRSFSDWSKRFKLVNKFVKWIEEIRDLV